jgi:hypothetical protein
LLPICSQAPSNELGVPDKEKKEVLTFVSDLPADIVEAHPARRRQRT